MLVVRVTLITAAIKTMITIVRRGVPGVFVRGTQGQLHALLVREHELCALAPLCVGLWDCGIVGLCELEGSSLFLI